LRIDFLSFPEIYRFTPLIVASISPEEDDTNVASYPYGF
jgi:hypothetical protein